MDRKMKCKNRLDYIAIERNRGNEVTVKDRGRVRPEKSVIGVVIRLGQRYWKELQWVCALQTQFTTRRSLAGLGVG